MRLLKPSHQLLLVLLSAAALPAPGRADVRGSTPATEPAPSNEGLGFFVSWDAPFGDPRARTTRLAACRDTNAVDTLYLCLRTGVRHPRFVAFTADLYFHAVFGDSLGTFWHFERGAANSGGLSVRYERDASDTTRFTPPWRSIGVGVVGYKRAVSSGQLRMAFAVDTAHAVPLEPGITYTLARIMVRARQNTLTGCSAPTIVEWRTGSLAFGPGAEFKLHDGGVRWALSGARALEAFARDRREPRRQALARLSRIEPAGRLDPGP